MAVVTKPIGRVIDDVVDVVKDVGDFVQDDILIPVVEGFEDVYKAIEDDPVRSIAYIAASFGAWWVLPLVVAADTMESGGDVDDALEASAKAYAMASVGKVVGGATATAVSSSATAASIGAAVGVSAQTVGAVAAGAAVGATSAIILGEDPVQAALMGGAQAGVSAAMASVRQNVSGYYADQDPILSDELAISGQKPTIEAVPPIPKAVLNVVESQLAYTLSGGDGVVSDAVIQQAIMRATITTTTMQEFVNNAGFEPNDAQLAALTNGVIQTTLAATQGGDVSGTVMKSIIDYSAKSLVKSFGEEAKTTIDKVRGTYETVEKKAGEYDFAAAEQEAAKTSYNDATTRGNEAKQEYDVLRAELEPRFAERDRLKAEMESAKADFESSAANINKGSTPESAELFNDLYNDSIKAYNTHTTQLDKDYSENYKPALDQYLAVIDATEIERKEYSTQVTTLTERANELYVEYETLQETLVQDAGNLDEALKPTYKATNQAFVKAMTNDTFNEEEYARLNALDDDDSATAGEEIDPYYHWLATGKSENLPINKEQYDNQFSEAANDLVLNSLSEAGLTLADLNQEQMKSLQQKIIRDHAGDLSSLKNADSKELGLELGKEYLTSVIDSSSASEEDKKNSIKSFSYETFNLENVKEFTTNDTFKSNVKKQTIEYNKNNVTDTQIANDTAVLKYNHNDGLINWEDIGGLEIPRYDSKYGGMVVTRKGSDGMTQTVDLASGEVIAEELRIRITPANITLKDGTTVPNGSLAHLKEQHPEKYLEQVSKLDADGGGAVNATYSGVPIYELAKNVFELAAETETGKDVLNSAFVKNFSGIATQAGGELVQAANGMLVFANINPESTPAGKWARDSIKLGGDMKTEEWQTASAGMFKNIDDANIEPKFLEDGVTPNPKAGQLKPGSSWDHFTNTMATAYGEFKNTPGVFMAEIIGKEVLQELPILVLSGGAGNVTKVFAKEMAEDLAQKMANKAALSTAVTLDAVEAGGGSASSAFGEAYAVALKSGMNETEAGNFALEVAKKAGVTAITASFITNKVGGATFEKAIYGGKKTNGSLASKFNDFAKVTGTEAGQGGIEETAVQGVIELSLHPLDPNRDVSGNLAKSLTFGVLAGGGTSSSLYAGKQVIDNSSDYITNVLTNTNPGISNIVKSYDGTSESLASAESQLSNLGLTSVAQNNVLSVMSPNDYTSSTNVFEAFKNVEGVYTPKINEVDQFVGKFSNEEFTNNFDTYIDKGTVSRQEILDAAASENVTLTEEQITDLIGQKNEVETITGAKIEFDPLGTTTTEATDFFKAIGYTPTGTEITQFTAPVSEVEQQEAIAKFADPRMTDRDEVTEYFSAIGYNPSEDDITQFIGQIEETKQKAAIGEFTDPKMVNETEAFEAFKTAGLEGARPDDIQSLIGQYDQNLLAGKVEEALPGARYNVLDYNLGEQTKKVDALSELLGTKDTKIDALSNLLTDQTTKTDALSSLLGTPATDTDTATGLYGTLSNQQTNFNTQINQQTQDFNALMNQQAADAKATADAAAAKEEVAKKAAATRATQQQQLQNTQGLYQALQSTPVTTGEVELANIGGPYDFGSIFRDAGQESFYQTPYRKGGQVNNINDRLLRLIGDN